MLHAPCTGALGMYGEKITHPMWICPWQSVLKKHYRTEKQPHDPKTVRLFFVMERMMGIEPTTSAWEAEVLPLNYIRKWKNKENDVQELYVISWCG